MKLILVILSVLMLNGCGTKNEESKQGMAYHQAYREDAICVACVTLEGDVIKNATLDELTFLSKDEYDGLITSLETTTQKHIASKKENSETYSQAMQLNGATHTILENYNAICDYVVGKRVEEIEALIENRTEQEVIDAVSGCTLGSTKGYLEAILKACHQAN